MHYIIYTEFRQQLIRLETLMERIPPLVIKDIERSCQVDYDNQKADLEATFRLRMKQIDTKRVIIINKIIPGAYMRRNNFLWGESIS